MSRPCIKPSKCRSARIIQYLGYIVGSGVRTPAEVEIKADVDFIPTTKPKLRAPFCWAFILIRFHASKTGFFHPSTKSKKWARYSQRLQSLF
ncbi:hypothetical protein AVEN_229591-1 [Araneus ventricosus]|uniref:Uncharacterized protein n=1 Tax=Araneus ventricosus TaxID=182803 RepID=A0A4Y2D9Z0_ARAVE|nr:hypothetical protein AVEN_229591-1 [Araneus ventricosus]